MLRHQIRDLLVERILDGEYAPGERLVETHLARELGVSKAPVREALRELESLRLVVSEPHRGASVRDLSADEIAEGYPVRAALESLAARAATEAYAGDVGQLDEEVTAMRAAAARGDVQGFIRHDVRFHRLIVEAAGNGTLLDLWDALHVDLRTTITLIMHRAELGQVAETHVAVLEALRSRDPARAADAVHHHITSFAGWAPAPKGSP
ncbi:MAG: hypothetical protein QOD73_78 [Solirubrobacteraceae bacterium]|jgi:DNA-binding GntR family transcriptional regulator|nr:hypothetical protein [Solirubrobacteraceae bacterium]